MLNSEDQVIKITKAVHEYVKLPRSLDVAETQHLGKTIGLINSNAKTKEVVFCNIALGLMLLKDDVSAAGRLALPAAPRKCQSCRSC